MSGFYLLFQVFYFFCLGFFLLLNNISLLVVSAPPRQEGWRAAVDVV
jgi:hypothetical protein